MSTDPEEAMQLAHRLLTRAVEYLDDYAPYEATASHDFGRGYSHAARVLERFRDLFTSET